MPFRANERLLTTVLTICFVTTVALLAYLQYRWSSEVSAAATTRMQSSLESSTIGFRQELSGQLGTLCLELQSEGGEETVDAPKAGKAVGALETHEFVSRPGGGHLCCGCEPRTANLTPRYRRCSIRGNKLAASSARVW